MGRALGRPVLESTQHGGWNFHDWCVGAVEDGALLSAAEQRVDGCTMAQWMGCMRRRPTKPGWVVGLTAQFSRSRCLNRRQTPPPAATPPSPDRCAQVLEFCAPQVVGGVEPEGDAGPGPVAAAGAAAPSPSPASGADGSRRSRRSSGGGAGGRHEPCRAARRPRAAGPRHRVGSARRRCAAGENAGDAAGGASSAGRPEARPIHRALTAPREKGGEEGGAPTARGSSLAHPRTFLNPKTDSPRTGDSRRFGFWNERMPRARDSPRDLFFVCFLERLPCARFVPWLCQTMLSILLAAFAFCPRSFCVLLLHDSTCSVNLLLARSCDTGLHFM